jgi:hypothetical protein
MIITNGNTAYLEIFVYNIVSLNSLIETYHYPHMIKYGKYKFQITELLDLCEN